MRKTVLDVRTAPSGHWVGDGFPVRSLFSHQGSANPPSPFLLLDYAGPLEFAPGTQPRGVGQHPHRGFETVTIVYSGEVEHRDSSGGGGKIGPGDVQWMTAGSGIMHEEFHSQDFTQHGGMLEMVQLWVNLPARDKMTPPRYQTLLYAEIPAVPLPDGAGQLRVIAGEYDTHRGPALTFSPLNVWDMRLKAGGSTRLRVPDGHTATLVLLSGSVTVNGTELTRDASLAMLGDAGNEIEVGAARDSVALLLSGEPIDEPVAAYGPFVMNTPAEIEQAIRDFQSGRFGRLAAVESNPH